MPILILYFILLLLLPSPLYSQEPLMISQATKEVLLSGYTRSATTVTITAEVSGRIEKINYDVGDIIRKQPLLEIDPTFVNYQIQQVAHEVQLNAIQQKKSDSTVNFLQKEYVRIKKLYEEQRASEVNKDTAAETLSQAVFERKTLDSRKKVLETSLAELKERLNRHQLWATEGWHVIDKIVESGEVISPGIPLMRVANFNHLVIQLSVSNAELKAIQSMENPFDITAGNEPAKAAIHWINPEFNESTRKLLLELTLSEYTGKKRGGILCTLPIMIDIDGFQIPKAAITNRYNNPRVTLQETGETINVMILSEVNAHFVIARDDRLDIGMPLAPAE